MLKVLHHFFILAIENTYKMRVVIQRVSQASVTVEGEKISEIGKGMLIFVGIEDSDNQEDIDWLANKIVQLRIFDDKQGVMNLSIKDIDGDILVVSQFTLHANTKKGNRPSYIRASKPDFAIPMYENLLLLLKLLQQKNRKPENLPQ
jgi:D-aminoacyl-tRNA deacylase